MPLFRIEHVHTLDISTHRLLERLLHRDTGTVAHMIQHSQEQLMTKLALLTAMAAQLIKDGRENKDAFAAFRAAEEKKGAALKASIDALQAKIDAGDDSPEAQAILDQLTEVHSTMTGTTGDAVAAANALGTELEGSTPAAATQALNDAGTAEVAPAPQPLPNQDGGTGDGAGQGGTG